MDRLAVSISLAALLVAAGPVWAQGANAAPPPPSTPPKAPAPSAVASPAPAPPKAAAKPEGAKPEPAKKPAPEAAKAPAAKPEPAKADAKPEAPKADAAKSPTAKPEAKPSAKPEATPVRDGTKAQPGSLPAAAIPGEAPSGIDPRRGRGARNVGEEPVEPAAPEVVPEKGPKTAVPTPPVKGKPGKPSPTRLKGTPRAEPDAVQRRIIAQGPTADDLRAGKDDAELRSLREAELVLFPQPLPGLVPGWSWDLPRPAESSLPEIVAGAPPASRGGVGSQRPAPGAEWLRGLAMPNLPTRLEERVLRYLTFYRDSPSGRSIAKVWAKKSGRYLGALRGELAKAGLPTDLVWLSLIESGHNPTIVSPAGAAGLWQFMPDAGRAYGLVIDRWVDERLDPERSTEAACRYLSDLYRRFGSWDLAMAGYNMGHGGLSRAIRKYNTNDFWELAEYEAGLPWETTLYVPKILATAIAMQNRRAFALDGVEPEPPERFESVLVGASVPLEDVARLAGVPLADVEALNPQYLAGRTPPSASGASGRSWPVRVPYGRGAGLHQALAREAPGDDSLLSHVVRAGETVESIAQARGTTEALVRALNRIDGRETLAVGTVLLVPRSLRPREDNPQENVVVVPPRSFSYPDRKRVFYRVVPSDTLARVASLFGVPAGDVLAWNSLDERARLHAGMVLQIFAAKGRDLSSVRHLSEKEAQILVAGTTAFFDYFEGQNGKKRFVVRAKSGDTLTSIGRRYGMTAGSMERANRRSRTDPVAAGEPIVVYTERRGPVAGDQLFAEARPTAARTPSNGAAPPVNGSLPAATAAHSPDDGTRVE